MFGPRSSLSILWGLASAVTATWAAERIYNFFEGEHLCADLIDEIRLRRRDIADLDRSWAKNPRRSSAIVTLTTIPSRMHLIADTLKSLMRQTRAPARIVLNVPAFSRREQRHYEVPDFIRRLQSVEVMSSDDWGPATKLIPTVLRYPPTQPIIVVDDDRIYASSVVANLEDASVLYPNCAVGLSGWRVPDDLTDRYSTLWSNMLMRAPAPIRAPRLKAAIEIDVLQGMSGYLVRPEYFDIGSLTDYSRAPEATFFVDDVWISGHCRARKLVIPASEANYQSKRYARIYKTTSVALINRGNGTPETRNNTIAIRHLRNAWLCEKRSSAEEKSSQLD
jgi:hypothetical protein